MSRKRNHGNKTLHNSHKQYKIPNGNSNQARERLEIQEKLNKNRRGVLIVFATYFNET